MKNGAIGVGTFNAEAGFYNIIVEGPGLPRTSVEFSGKLTTAWASIKDENSAGSH